jgi:hypothetical protein
MPSGMPLPSTSRLRLAPFLARSVGFFPVFFPPEGCLGHAPVHTQPFPVYALQAVILQESGLPECQEYTIGDPLLEPIMGRGTRAELRRIQCFPLATRAQDEENRVHAHAIGRAWPTTPKAMRVHVLRQVHGDLDPEIIRDAPIVGNDVGPHGLPSAKGDPAAWHKLQLPTAVIALRG